ncbi:MAG: hypothetical protein WAU45_01365, partial [Blastocatellia bacterium]
AEAEVAVAAAAEAVAATAAAGTNEPCGKAATATHLAVAAGLTIEANSRTRAEWIARSLLLRHHRYTTNGLTSNHSRRHDSTRTVFTFHQSKCTERKIDELKQF